MNRLARTRRTEPLAIQLTEIRRLAANRVGLQDRKASDRLIIDEFGFDKIERTERAANNDRTLARPSHLARIRGEKRVLAAAEVIQVQ